MKEVWEVKSMFNIDGIAESETWLFESESQALSLFHAKAEEDFKEIKNRRTPAEIHINPESIDNIDDGDYIIEYTDYDYCSYEQGYGGNSLIEFSVRQKKVQ